MTVNTGGTAQDTIERLQAKIKELEEENKDKSQLLSSFRSQIKELEGRYTLEQVLTAYEKVHGRECDLEVMTAALQENE